MMVIRKHGQLLLYRDEHCEILANFAEHEKENL